MSKIHKYLKAFHDNEQNFTVTNDNAGKLMII